jgi:hypothetical protein
MSMQESCIPLLTPEWVMVLFPQQTRQASVLRDMLNSGGFLFSGAWRVAP